MIWFNFKTGSKVKITPAAIAAYGSAEEFIKAISLWYNPTDWTSNESYFNYWCYVESFDVINVKAGLIKLSSDQFITAIKQLEFRLIDPCGPKDLREVENRKIQEVLAYFKS